MTFRITEQSYLVLLALAEEPRHGYGVVKAVVELSDGAVKLGAGTLYGILDRLVAAEMAEASGEFIVDGRLRRYYQIIQCLPQLDRSGNDALQAFAVVIDRQLTPTSCQGEASPTHQAYT